MDEIRAIERPVVIIDGKVHFHHTDIINGLTGKRGTYAAICPHLGDGAAPCVVFCDSFSIVRVDGTDSFRCGKMLGGEGDVIGPILAGVPRT